MPKNIKLNSNNLIIVFSVICILVVFGLIINSLTGRDNENKSSSSSSTSSAIQSSVSSSSISSSQGQSVSDPASPTNPPVPIILPNPSN